MSIRCFAAVALDSPALVAALVKAQEGLRAAGAAAKWVPPANFHLTLKFLGDQEPAAVEGALAALRRAANRTLPFEMALSGLGAFGDGGRPRVLWAGVTEGRGALEGLAEAVEREMAAAGFAPEARRFRPHLTLARIREGAPAPASLADYLVQERDRFLGKLSVSGAVLMKSELRPSGPLYTPLGHAPFGGGA